MSFSQHLEAVVAQVDGAVAASVMGFDGITVETHPPMPDTGDVELASAWIEYANVLTQLKNAAETLRTGDVTEVSVNSARLVSIMRMVTPEYFVVLSLKPDGNLGKGRYVLRLAESKLKAEF